MVLCRLRGRCMKVFAVSLLSSQYVRGFVSSSTCFSWYKNKYKIPKLRGEYLYGVAPCTAAVSAKRRKIFEVFMKEDPDDLDDGILERKSQTDILLFCQRNGTRIHYVNRQTLVRMSGNRPHQGIIMDVEPLKLKTMDLKHSENIFGYCTSGDYPLWLALDGVQDPMNFGAILRCAHYLGVEQVVVTAKNSCSLTPTVSKASSGAMEVMDVHSVQNLPKFLHLARDHRWSVLGTCCPNSIDDVYLGAPVSRCDEYKITSPTILILGNEGKGLQTSVERVCTHMLTIPSFRKLGSESSIESLNVSVATGIILYSLQTCGRSCKTIL